MRFSKGWTRNDRLYVIGAVGVRLSTTSALEALPRMSILGCLSMGTSQVFVYFYSSFRYLNKRRGKSKKHTAAKKKHIESQFRKADRESYGV